MERRSRAAVVTLTAMAMLTLSVTGSFAAPAIHRPADTLDRQPCSDAPAARRSTLAVPIDWQHPNGPHVTLALARRQATDPEHRIGSLLLNLGGPGASGVEDIKDGTDGFSADLRSRFDVVSWDPRGVGLSHPVVCNTRLADNPVSLFPTDQAGFAALRAYTRSLMTSCRAHTGPLFDHLDTASSARDMEAIRAAIGEPRLSFYGLSYGTLLGEQYAEMFPRGIRAMTLDSNEDHSVGALCYVTTPSRALEDSFGQFADWCMRTPSCALYPRDPRSILDDICTKAQRGELFILGSPDQLISPEDLLGAVRCELVGVGDWPSLAENMLGVASETASSATRHAALSTPSTATATEPSPEAGKTVVICEDHVWDVSNLADLQDLRRAMSHVAPHTHMSTTGFKDITGCLGFPRRYPTRSMGWSCTVRHRFSSSTADTTSRHRTRAPSTPHGKSDPAPDCSPTMARHTPTTKKPPAFSTPSTDTSST